MSERVYEITFSDRGPMRVTVPDTWKITFGAVVPGKGGGAQFGSFGIRLWEATDKQRAVFANVTSFRDLSIPIQVAAIRKFGTDEWYRDDDQTWVGEVAALVEKAWRPESEVAAGKPPWQDELLGDSPLPFRRAIKRA